MRNLLRCMCVSALLGAMMTLAQAPAAKHVAVPTVPPRAEDVATVDGMIRAWYDIVSGPAGKHRDWGRDRTLYIPEIRFVIAGVEDGKPYSRVVDHQSFVDSSDEPLLKGFFEREIYRVTDRFGPIVHVWSTYESRDTENGPVTARGINSINLVWDGTRWWIANATWTEETKEAPIPARYLPPVK